MDGDTESQNEGDDPLALRRSDQGCHRRRGDQRHPNSVEWSKHASNVGHGGGTDNRRPSLLRFFVRPANRDEIRDVFPGTGQGMDM